MMTEDKTHRPDDDTCEHCESQQPTALQRAFAAAMALLQRTVVIRSIVLGGTAFLTVVWFQLTSYFLWLLYSGIGVVVSVCGLVQRLVWDEASLSGSDWWLLLLTIALHAVFAPTCVIMLLQTFFGLVHNNTKIEIWERHWAVVDAQRRGDPAYQYPYERGTALGNVIEVFGTNPLAWWVPVYTGLVNGLDYGVLVPVNSNAPPAKAIQTV